MREWRRFRRPTGVTRAEVDDDVQHHDDDSDSDDGDDDVLQHHNGIRPVVALRLLTLNRWPSEFIVSISDMSSSCSGEEQEEEDCLQAIISDAPDMAILDDLHGLQVQQHPFTQTDLEVHNKIAQIEYSYNLLPGFNNGTAS